MPTDPMLRASDADHEQAVAVLTNRSGPAGSACVSSTNAQPLPMPPRRSMSFRRHAHR